MLASRAGAQVLEPPIDDPRPFALGRFMNGADATFCCLLERFTRPNSFGARAALCRVEPAFGMALDSFLDDSSACGEPVILVLAGRWVVAVDA